MEGTSIPKVIDETMADTMSTTRGTGDDDTGTSTKASVSEKTTTNPTLSVETEGTKLTTQALETAEMITASSPLIRKQTPTLLGDSIDNNDENELEFDVKSPPVDAFSKCHTMVLAKAPLSSNLGLEGGSCKHPTALRNHGAILRPKERPLQQHLQTALDCDDSEYVKAKKLLEQELPRFVTPIESSVIETCLSTLFLYVSSNNGCPPSSTPDELCANIENEALDLLWGEILHRVSNIKMQEMANEEDPRRPSNLTVPRILDTLNGYVTFIEITTKERISEPAAAPQVSNLEVKFSKVRQRVAPLLKPLTSSLPSPLEEKSPSVNLWSQIVSTFPASIVLSTEENSASVGSSFGAPKSPSAATPLECVHGLLTLACGRILDLVLDHKEHVDDPFLVFSNAKDPNEGDGPVTQKEGKSPHQQSIEHYSITNITHHWTRSALNSSSLYLLFLNASYLSRRIAAELLLNREDQVMGCMDIWTNENFVLVLSKFLEEIEVWYKQTKGVNSSPSEDAVVDLRFEQVIHFWYKTMIPSQSSLELLDVCFENCAKLSLSCHRAGQFLSLLGLSIGRALPSKKILPMEYFLHAIQWKWNAACYLSLDTSGTQKTFASGNPGKNSARKIGRSSSTEQESGDGRHFNLDPLHIVAIVLGQSGTRRFLDVVDVNGVHTFLPYTIITVALCQDLAETLYSLGLMWYDNGEIDRAMSCLNAAREILLLKSPSEGRSSADKQNLLINSPGESSSSADSLDLSVSDGLTFGVDDETNRESSNVEPPKEIRRNSRHGLNDTNSSSATLSPVLLAEDDRWAILSGIELHRGMSAFTSNLSQALDCFHHSKDYMHRSNRNCISAHRWQSEVRPSVVNESERTSLVSRVRHLEQLSTVYSWIASAYRELGQSRMALEFFQESMEYTEQCANVVFVDSDVNVTQPTVGPWLYKLHLANGLFNMAVTLDDMGMYNQSLSRYHDAYSILATVWDEYCTSPSAIGCLSQEAMCEVATLGNSGSILMNAWKSASATSASVLGDMLEIWLCLGNVNLSLQQQREDANKSGEEHQVDALLCFMKGLKLFLEEWCSVSAPNVLSPRKIENGDQGLKKIVVDADGQQLHCIADFMAKYSQELLSSAEEGNGVGRTSVDQFMGPRTESMTSNDPGLSAVAGTVTSYVMQLKDGQAVEHRARRLVERAKEVLQSFTHISRSADVQRRTKKESRRSEIDFPLCWLLLSDVEVHLRDIVSALECIGRSYHGKPAEELDSLYFYRLGVCYLRIRDYKAATESFNAFLSCSNNDAAATSALNLTREGDAFYHLGYAHAQLGHYTRSIEFYRKSLQYRMGSADENGEESQRDDRLMANVFLEMSCVYLLECSMKHDECGAFSESPSMIDVFEGIQSSLSTDSVAKYMNNALLFYRSACCCSVADVVGYAFARKHMGIFYRICRLWNEANECFQVSLDMLGELPRTNENALEIAAVSYEVGVLHSLWPKISLGVEGNPHLDSAEVYLRQALHVYERQVELSEEERDFGSNLYLAKTWYHLGRVNMLKEPVDMGVGTLGSIALEFIQEALTLMTRIHPAAILSTERRNNDVVAGSATLLWNMYTSEFVSQLYHDIGEVYISFRLYTMALECFDKSENLRLHIISLMKTDAMVDPVARNIAVVDSFHANESNLIPVLSSRDGDSWNSVGNVHYMKLAKTLNNMSVVYSKLGQYETSSRCLDRALEIRAKRRELFWATDKMSTQYGAHILVEQEYATALINAGHVHEKMRLHSKALDVFETAADILESIVDSKGCYWHLANVYHSIGRLHASVGSWVDAKTFYEKSLSIRRLRHPNPGTVMVDSDDSLSDDYYREIMASIPLYDSNEEVDSALRLSHTLHQLGAVHENLKDYRDAMICYEEAWFVRKLHLTRDHVIMAQSLCRIGHLRVIDGCNYDVALKCYQEALRVQRLNLGDYALAVSETYYRMGMIHHVRGEFGEARRCYLSALRIYQFHGVGKDRQVMTAEDESAIVTMQEVLDAWTDLELVESESGAKHHDWNKLSVDPKGCVARMEEVLVHLLLLLDKYFVQPGMEKVQKTGSLVMDSIVDVCGTANRNTTSRALPPPPVVISPSPQFIFDTQQQLCLIHE